eukprot:SAG31_NODE_2977_length_4833_cov_5.035488_1_plen_81_part_00
MPCVCDDGGQIGGHHHQAVCHAQPVHVAGRDITVLSSQFSKKGKRDSGPLVKCFDFNVAGAAAPPPPGRARTSHDWMAGR